MRRCAIPWQRRGRIVTAAERLKKARLQAGFSSIAEAARVTKLHKQNWADHEAGRRQIRETNARAYAKALKVSWVWLLTGHDGETGQKVPLVGYVGAGAQVYALGVQELDFIDAPPGADAEDIAFTIRGASMAPFREGGIILARPVSQITDVLYRLAVVDLDDGTRWFKQVLPSSEPGRYTLTSLTVGVDPMVNVRIVSAARFRIYIEPA